MIKEIARELFESRVRDVKFDISQSDVKKHLYPTVDIAINSLFAVYVTIYEFFGEEIGHYVLNESYYPAVEELKKIYGA